MQEAIDNGIRLIDVTNPNIKPLFEEFKKDVLNNAYNTNYNLR